MASLFDFNDPIFRPRWIRLLCVAVPGLWGVFEFVSGSPFWGTIFCAAAALAFKGLFIDYDPNALDAAKEEPRGREIDDDQSSR